MEMSGRSRFWMLVVAVLAVCGALIPATTVPAYASSNELKFFWHADRTAPWREVVLSDDLCDQNPQMARNSNNTGAVITCLGPGNSLWFWSINDGTWTPNAEEVAGYGSAFSDPAITTNSAGTEIAAEGPGNSLWFWWNLNGSPTWNGEMVAGPGTTYSAPAITDSGTATEISAAGPNGTLWFHWATHGSSNWYAQQAGGPGAVAGNISPGMVLGPLDNAEISVIAEYSPLYLWRQGIFGEWTSAQIGNPDLAFELHAWSTRSATGTEIATNVEGYIFVWFNTDGSQAWTLGVPSTTRDWYGSAITRDSGGTEIAASAFDGSLYLFGNTDGSTSWSSTLVAGPGTVSTDAFTSWPAIVRYPSHSVGQTGGTEIAVVGPSGP